MLNLITKLYEKKYGCQPASTPRGMESGAAPGAPSNLFSKPPNNDDEHISDDYDDDFDDVEDKKKSEDARPNLKSKPAAAADEEDDDWDLGDDWGE